MKSNKASRKEYVLKKTMKDMHLISRNYIEASYRKMMSLSPENIDVSVAIRVSKLMFCRPESKQENI